MRREFLRRNVEGDESKHRRRVLVVIGILTLVAISPVLGHHVSSRLGEALSGKEHLWGVCLVAIHLLMAPVHLAFHLLLGAGIAYAVVDRARAWLRNRRTLRLLETRTARAGDAAWAACQTTGVPVTLLRLATGLPNPAFTTGWLRPVIYVDERLQSALSQGQLAAVLLHEYAHVLRRDPARLTLLRALGCLLFWLPALRRLARDVADDAEVAADDFAARRDPVMLASAILQLAQWPSRTAGPHHEGHGVVGFQRDTMLDRRIHRLLGNEAPIATHVTWRSVIGASAGLLLAWTSGIAVAHPMTDASQHCRHRHAWAYEHLFCMAGHPDARGSGCPHEHLVSR